MVRGFSIAVIPVPSVSQCADMQSIALGLGREAPNLPSASVKSFLSTAVMGEPCPTKSTGMRFSETIIIRPGQKIKGMLSYSAKMKENKKRFSASSHSSAL
jgi:hypothetical protein